MIKTNRLKNVVIFIQTIYIYIYYIYIVVYIYLYIYIYIYIYPEESKKIIHELRLI